MKRTTQYIIIIILFSLWGILLTDKKQAQEMIREKIQAPVRDYISPVKPCSEPFEYAIGTVDPKFNISLDEFSGIVRETQEVWNKAAGKNILHYNPEAQFKINLIYDQRQAQTDEAQDMETKLKDLEATHEKLESQANTISNTYEKKMAAYNKALADYKKDVEKYNKDVEYWNDKGGAPQDVYDELQKDKREIDNEYKELEKMRKEINALAGQSVDIVSQDAGIINKYNSNVVTYKNKYGGAHEFEKGIFDGQSINIYQFIEKSDLRLTLIHEMGHALGLDHVQNTASIMYYMIGDQDMDSPKLSIEDVSELKKVCQMD